MPHAFDFVLDHPLKPRFLFFCNLEFYGISTVERRNDSNDALFIKASSVSQLHPPLSSPDRFGDVLFSRRSNEVYDVVPESRGHLEGWQFWFFDGVDESRHSFHVQTMVRTLPIISSFEKFANHRFLVVSDTCAQKRR